ncbi:MAG: ABC transporter ATP-binding protein [Acidobacteriota bacterium]
MEQKTIISTENLVKTYKDNGMEAKAVRGINLDITSGEFTAVVGPSGSGKTTFLNLISGLDTPTDGRVLINNRLISEMKGRELSDFRRDNIGFVFQSYNLIPVLTVEENIEYIMLLQNVPKSERHSRVLKILDEVGLKGLESRRPTQLSGGQQQRVAIARAMVSGPSLILADEPTANLDSEMGSELLEMMRVLNESTGMTFIFSTHDEMIMDRARRLITLKDGIVKSDETR